MDDGFQKELKVKKLDISTGELVAILNEEDAKDLGVQEMQRVIVKNPKTGKFVALVVDITSKYIKEGEIGVFENVFDDFELNTDVVYVRRAKRPESIEYIKEKINGNRLSFDKIKQIVEDIKYNRLSRVEMTAFMTSVHIHGFNDEESFAMAKSIGDSGRHLSLDVDGIIVDKHSIGGINGRATMIVVPIVAALGLYIPKTSSRAITSAAGTADAMECLAEVEFDIKEFKEIVEKVNGAIIWGGGIDLAPVDDKIIRVEYPLSLDPRGQVIASVLAKKYAVGAKKVVIDVPMGREMKVKNISDAESIANSFIYVGKRLGMDIKALITNGEIPSGPAFGPALEAKHVLRILEGKIFDNLAEKSVELAGKILELAGKAPEHQGTKKAKEILRSGKALAKMREIIKAQKGDVLSSRDVEIGEYSLDVYANTEGYIQEISIKNMVKVARAAGAPYDKGAGVLLNVDINDNITKGDLLFTIFAENKEKLESAYKLALKLKPINLESMVIKEL